jgi:hypothetical protein
MTDSREVRQQELARRLLQKARQDQKKIVEWADTIVQRPVHGTAR